MTPRTIAPASTSRCATGADSTAYASPRATTPALLGMSATATASFTVHGTPSSGGSTSPGAAAATLASAISASRRAASYRSATTALTAWLTRSRAATCTSTTSRALIRRRRIASARAVADIEETSSGLTSTSERSIFRYAEPEPTQR